MEKLTVDNLLTWNDIMNLGDPLGKTSIFVPYYVLKNCCKNKYDAKIFDESFAKYIVEDVKNRFPELETKINNLDYRLAFCKKDDGSWYLSFSLPHIISSLYFSFGAEEYDQKREKDLLQTITLADYKELVECSILLFKSVKSDIIAKIAAVDKELLFDSNNTLLLNVRNSYVDQRTCINWVLKNIEHILSYFQKDYPIEVLKSVNKDKFMLSIVSLISNIEEIKSVFNGDFTSMLSNIDNPAVKSALNYTNNYSLIIKYIEENNNDDYKTTGNLYTNEGDISLISSGVVLKWFDSLNKDIMNNNQLNKKINYYRSYEELLKEKATETWKRLQNEKLVKNIKVNFEMIKSGPKINLDSNSNRKLLRITSNNEKKQARLKHDYDILDQKINYFYSKNPVVNLVGINTFTGYFAQFYANGVVVLDKLYRYTTDKKGKEVIAPAGNEAIYIMNYKEFADLSKYTKMELVQEISQFNNPDVKRIYHSTKWMNKVDRIIEGPGYGELDLNLLNMLTAEISVDSEKVYIK